MKKKKEVDTATMDIWEITSMEEFLRWARRVNEAYGNEYLHKLQDIFSRSKMDELVKWFCQDDSQKRLLLFSTIKCMGEDIGLEFLRKYMRRIVDDATEKEEKRLEEELGKKIMDYEWRKAELEKKENGYLAEIKQLNRMIEGRDKQVEKLYGEMNALKQEFQVADRIAWQAREFKSALKALLEMED